MTSKIIIDPSYYMFRGKLGVRLAPLDSFYYFFSKRRNGSSGAGVSPTVVGILAIEADILDYLDPFTLDGVEDKTNGG